MLLVSLSPRCPRPAGGGNAWPPFDGYIGIAVRWQARRPHTGGWPLVGSDASVALPRGAADSRCHSQKCSVSNRGSPPACPGGEGIGAAAGNGNSRDASWNTDSQVLSTKVSPYAHSPKTINLVPRSSKMAPPPRVPVSPGLRLPSAFQPVGEIVRHIPENHLLAGSASWYIPGRSPRFQRGPHPVHLLHPVACKATAVLACPAL